MKRNPGRGLLLGALLLPCALAGGGLALWWGLATEPGSAWLLRQVPGLELEGAQGSVLGDFSARRLRYRFPGGADTLTIRGLRAHGTALGWHRSPQLWGRLLLESVSAERVELSLAPSAEATAAPQNLRLPFALDVASLSVAELRIPSLSDQPLQTLQASLSLGADGGAMHRARIAALRWDQRELSGEASVESGGKMRVQAQLLVRQPAAAKLGAAQLPAWTARLQADGPLLHLPVQAQLDSPGYTSEPSSPQTLKASATLAPFEAWPLQALDLQTQGLDLAQLQRGAPRTSLVGSVSLRAAQAQAPLRISAALRNGMAGRFDAQALPLRQLALELELKPWDPASLHLQQLDLQLGTQTQAAGRLHALGNLGSSAGQAGSQLRIDIEGLRSELLDNRLAPALASGQLRLQTQAGLQALAAWPPVALSLDLKGRLAPELQAAEFSLQAEAALSPAGLSLQQWRLLSGGGRLEAQGALTLQQAGHWSRGWHAQLQARMSALDLRHFWRGAAGGTWRSGSQSLNASLDARLSRGPTVVGTAPWRHAPQGQALLQIQPSQLAGLPLTGELRYTREGEAAPQAQLALKLAGNQLQASLAADASERLRLASDWQAPQLAALQPWLSGLLPGLNLQGELTGTLALALTPAPKGQDAAPPWQLSSEAQLQIKALRVSAKQLPALQIKQAQLQASLGGGEDAPLRLQAGIQQLDAGSTLHLRELALALDGPWSRHQLTLSAQGDYRLPGWLNGTAQGPLQSGGLRLSLEGGWSQPPARAWREGARWQVRQLELLARPDKPALPAWLAASQLALQLEFGAQGRLDALQAAPGRLELLGAGFAWRQFQLDALTAAAPQLELELAMEPLAVAPLLARWQPGFGWGGNLVMGGAARVSSGVRNLKVDVALQRSAGDLSVTDERGTQALGLTELRFGLLADQGVWHLTQAIAGQNLGALGGALTAHAAAPQQLPDRNAPLEGVLEARVANLGTWGAWVPTGWRLGGSLFASLSLGGTLGAPQITGQAGGQGLSLRNPLDGVDLQQGEFGLRLSGESARLEHLSARGGEGMLRAEGQVLLGAEPSAEFRLSAERFALLRRVDRRLVLSGESLVKLSRQGLDVGGKLRADEGLFDFTRGNAPQLDEDVLVLRPEDGQLDRSEAANGASKLPVHVQLELDLGRQLRLRGRGLDTLLAGQLKLTHSHGKPALHGVVSAVGGSFDAYAQKLEIERGQISFAGAADNPRLDVLAIRPGLDDARVGVTVTGTALNPRIKLYSEPEMRDSDKLSWLVLGRAPESLGRADTALLQRAAMALLSGEGESASGKLMRNLGLDELSVHQDADEAKGTVVRLGKQLSRRVYVGYERGLNATAGSWQLVYRIAQRFTLRAQSGDDNALDFIWQWKWE
ncbi:translocation/assembly module TamB domain-containing protein [Paucibacter soli]|uniref:translocation/assembly module TamB domain-containing protein n=1 Tax=Paucibacter soli TaxID=3133433 RepID=UPI0030AE48E8